MDQTTTTRPWIDIGLLITRVGLGASMAVFHGWGKIYGGPEKWAGLGRAMGTFGVDVAPVFWGFCAAFAEFFGAILLAAGMFFRPAAFLLAFTMLVATVKHAIGGEMFAWPLDLLIVFTALMITGPGRIAVRQLIPPLRDGVLG
ncbi:MAG: DoxX family membrane protein [Planctomycetes bacterium]|jgi:putative oxidoreductase|nr:DoxX family protein [Phycisphaerae bacterium]NBB95217.1 DoxX family membrane protein [Planctomycetota bacterium]